MSRENQQVAILWIKLRLSSKDIIILGLGLGLGLMTTAKTSRGQGEDGDIIMSSSHLYIRAVMSVHVYLSWIIVFFSSGRTNEETLNSVDDRGSIVTVSDYKIQCQYIMGKKNSIILATLIS